MIPRERILTTLAHQEPDRIPVDLGGTGLTGIHKNAYTALVEYLGLPKKKIRIANAMEQIAVVEPELLDAIGIEKYFVGVGLNLPPEWKLEIWEENEYLYYYDEWGIKWGKPKHSELYFDMVEHPLANYTSIAQLIKHPWPKANQSFFKCIDSVARSLRQTPYAIIGGGPIGTGIFLECCWLSGMEKFFEDLLLRPAYAKKLVEKITEIQLTFMDQYLDKVGPYLDIYILGDDWCGQDGPFISPRLLRELIIPPTREQISLIKKKSKAKVFFHNCGSVVDLIPDMIEMGIDILNPVQLTARGMEAKKLKREFGQDIVFWGGIDTQKTLPFGNPDEVCQHTREVIDALAPGGGFVFNTSHNIQSGTPPENILAMYETVKQYGVYKK